MGYSPWGRKESDTTERLHFHSLYILYERINVQSWCTELGKEREPLEYNKMFDYDIMDYRKVVSVTNYSESGVSSITSLYNFDTSLAQQFFSYKFLHS